MGRKKFKVRGPAQRAMAGADFQLSEEIAYIQRRAAEHDGRVVMAGPLVFFSTDTGDAWLLDPADQLAARLARDGDPQHVYFEDTEARFAIGWQGNYRIDGDAFIYSDRDTARTTTILGYPTRRIEQLRLKISNMFG